METWYYEVVSIDGDYANLKRTDIESDDLKLVARALLPPEIMEGSRLKYEMMQYLWSNKEQIGSSELVKKLQNAVENAQNQEEWRLEEQWSRIL